MTLPLFNKRSSREKRSYLEPDIELVVPRHNDNDKAALILGASSSIGQPPEFMKREVDERFSLEELIVQRCDDSVGSVLLCVPTSHVLRLLDEAENR